MWSDNHPGNGRWWLHSKNFSGQFSNFVYVPNTHFLCRHPRGGGGCTKCLYWGGWAVIHQPKGSACGATSTLAAATGGIIPTTAEVGFQFLFSPGKGGGERVLGTCPGRQQGARSDVQQVMLCQRSCMFATLVALQRWRFLNMLLPTLWCSCMDTHTPGSTAHVRLWTCYPQLSLCMLAGTRRFLRPFLAV